jgi:hypothetical protein
MSDQIGPFSWWRLLIALVATAVVAGGTVGSFIIALRLMK